MKSTTMQNHISLLVFRWIYFTQLLADKCYILCPAIIKEYAGFISKVTRIVVMWLPYALLVSVVGNLQSS